jgi:hypothetical protein
LIATPSSAEETFALRTSQDDQPKCEDYCNNTLKPKECTFYLKGSCIAPQITKCIDCCMDPSCGDIP